MEHVETFSITILMRRESLRSVRGEQHTLKMFKYSSPQGVTAKCGVNRAAGAGGQFGDFRARLLPLAGVAGGRNDGPRGKEHGPSG